MKLSVEWNDFQETIHSLTEEANELCEIIIKSEEDFVQFDEKYNKWHEECKNYLITSFYPNDVSGNEFSNEFINTYSPRYFISRNVDFQNKIKYKRDDIEAKTKLLAYFLRILSVSDAIVKPEFKIENITTEETLELILFKLYDLYDNYFHSVDTILWGNGIKVQTHDESRELTKILEQYGYVEIRPSQKVLAKLTLKGKMYIEKKKKKSTSDYSKINDSQTAINDKIDEVIEHLNKLGLGQEIIFDELNDLKVLYGKLDKKNWGQLLKGKLVDLGLSQVVNIEILENIYNELTNEVLRLL